MWMWSWRSCWRWRWSSFAVKKKSMSDIAIYRQSYRRQSQISRDWAEISQRMMARFCIARLSQTEVNGESGVIASVRFSFAFFHFNECIAILQQFTIGLTERRGDAAIINRNALLFGFIANQRQNLGPVHDHLGTRHRTYASENRRTTMSRWGFGVDRVNVGIRG